VLENDSFDPSDRSDRDYTSGLRLALTRSPCRSAPQWAERLVKLWCRSGLCSGDQHSLAVGYIFGQSIYTPTRYDSTAPRPFDRPYAGHLFGSFMIQATHSKGGDSSEAERDQTIFEMQLGLVGPHAYGEEVQNGWHRLWQEEEALGWDNQLADEPTFNLNILSRRKFGGRYLDVVPHWGIQLGTVRTGANLGATLRIGSNLVQLPEFGLPRLRRSSASKSQFEASAFVGVDGRYVAHDIFVDGGVFRKLERSRIEPKSFVYDVKAGFELSWKQWAFHYTWTHRGPDFESRLIQDGGEQDIRAYALTHRSTWP